MGIDGFTLSAQVVNFLVLVWLLKHFLYRRIVQTMDAREAAIVGQLNDAAQARVVAEQEANLYRTKHRELGEERDRMLARSQEDIEARRREMMRFARAEVEEAQAKWFDALVRERQAIVRDLRERVGERVLAVARRALKELAGVELKREAPTIFLERLRSLPLA